jgi:hypothetical protein
MSKLAAYLVIVLWLAGISILVVMGTQAYFLPACQEDSVLVGQGQFRGGRWTEYVCGPAVDDYNPHGYAQPAGEPSEG